MSHAYIVQSAATAVGVLKECCSDAQRLEYRLSLSTEVNLAIYNAPGVSNSKQGGGAVQEDGWKTRDSDSGIQGQGGNTGSEGETSG